METLAMMLVTIFIPLINSRVIEPRINLGLVGSLLIPNLILFGMVYLTNLITSMIRSRRKCQNTWGIKSAARKGVLIGIFGLLTYALTDVVLPVIKLIEFMFSFLPYVDAIAKGVFLSLGVFVGYLVSILFWGYC